MTPLRGLVQRGWLCALLAAPLLLGGCAMTRMIDSDVQSFTGAHPAVTRASYRFERLPSHAASANRDSMEAMAAQALDKIGLRLDPQHPRYSVQLDVNVEQFDRIAQRPMRPWNFSWGLGTPGAFFGYGSGYGMMEPAWYQYTVHLLLREVATNEVAYETSASHTGPWSDTSNLLPVILDAALRDYPNPPPGPRKVLIELAPSSSAPAR